MNTRVRDRTLTSILLAIAAFVLGLIAQGYLSRSTGPMDGLLIYGVVLLLFAIAVLRTPGPPGLPPPRVSLISLREATTIRDWVWLTWPIVLLLLSGLMTVISLALFRDDSYPSQRWILHLSAIASFVAASYALSREWTGQSQRHAPSVPEGCTERMRLSWWQVGLLLVILALGMFLRLYHFAEYPYGLWYDEADNGLWVREILANPRFRPVYVASTNLPAHFLYLVALSFRLLGDSMHAIRAVAVVFGVLTVAVAFFCGRELGGSDLGLGLAFLVAVSPWDLNWSRIGMHGVTVPFFELWIVAALLHGLRTGRLTSFAWTGVALGLGLCFYTPLRLFPVILAGFLGSYGWRWYKARRRRENSDEGQGRVESDRHKSLLPAAMPWLMPGLLLVLGTLIVVAPVAQFALRNPDLFWDRAKRISLFNESEARSRPVYAVLNNTAKHLLMFNYRGDPNGRHNLPGAPMLSRLGGVLFVLGGVISLASIRQPRSLLLGLWLLIPLSGGILTTWFESPQSLRSIGSLPAAYALICLPLEWFAAEWRRTFARSRARAGLMALATILLLAIAVENTVSFFYLRARDFASWAAFNAAETRLSQDINLYRDQYKLRFDPLLTAHLTTRYLAPDFETYDHFDPATVFPLRGTDKEGALLFIAPDTFVVRQQAKRLYPLVQVDDFAHPYTQLVVMHRYLFKREVIDAQQGLDALYAPVEIEQRSAQPSPQPWTVEPEVDFAWDGSPPLAYPFQATWVGGLLAPDYGVYTLRVEGSGEFSLELDGRLVMDGMAPQEKQIVMAQGVHTLYMDLTVRAPGSARLLWRTPDDSELRPVPHDTLYRASWPVRGLLGRFYSNMNWAGEPETVRVDRQIGYYFHFLPLPRPYTVEWMGQLAVPLSGTYRFGLKAISNATLWIDDQLVVDTSRPGQFQDAAMVIDAGMHDIRVRFLDNQSHSQVYLYWQVPDRELELIPFDTLFLPDRGTWWSVP